MRRRNQLRLAVIVVSLLGAVAGSTATSSAAPPPWWHNCTTLNIKYPHGLGLVGAHDKTSGDPVTNFKRSNALYKLAMRHNKRLDRDKDGIACEKH